MTEARAVVVISHDLVGARMAGPGIRYAHLARELAREFTVTLAVPPNSGTIALPDIQLLPYASGQDPLLEAAVMDARAVVVPAVAFNQFPVLRRTSTPLAIDGYNPVVAEALVMAKEHAHQNQVALTEAALAGDFFMCASERQRDWWLGYLEALGRVNVHTHEADPTLRHLVDLVPFGLPEGEPRSSGAVIKGTWPGIEATDRVILWGGGLWPWLDPLTAIRAMALIAPQQRLARLVFPGTRHPNPGVAAVFNLTEAARTLAAELSLLNKQVFFGDWVAYADWPSVLCESDVALTLSAPDTLETRLAFRSRVLDYIWAGLPIVASRGDATSELIAAHNLGWVVDDTPTAVARALVELLETPRESFATQFSAARAALTWECAAQPLLEFCRQAQPAPDKSALGSQLGNAHYVRELDQWRAKVQLSASARTSRWWHKFTSAARRGRTS